MALTKIGAQDIRLRLYRMDTTTWYDLVVKDGIELTREKNVASCLTCEVLRDSITPERGDVVKLVVDVEHEQFQGTIRKTSKSQNWCQITAYDQIEILNKSDGYYSYENITATEVVRYAAEACGLAFFVPPHFMDSEYKLPATVEDTTWLDIIHNAIDTTARNANKRFYLWDDCSNLCFHSEAWLAEQSHIIASGDFILSYSYDEDSSSIYTQVTAIEETKKENEEAGERKLTVVKNADLERRFGTINKNVKVNEGENAANVAQITLDEAQATSVTLSVNGCQGDITVRGGTPVKVDFYSEDNMEYIRGWFSVESVTHHFEAGYHDMDFKATLIKMVDNWDSRSPDWSFPE